MKKLKHIINWSIWSIVALYVGLMVVIHIPQIQQMLGEKVASELSSKLGTKVTVERIDLGFLNRIIIDNILICDQADEELLRAGRMSVKVDLLPLLEGKVSISSAQLFGANVHLYKTDSLAKPNYQFIVDSLASNDSTSNSSLNLRINSLIIRRSNIAYDENDAPETPERINLKHLNINDISAHVILKTLDKDSLNLNVKRLAFNEQSGLEVNRFAMKLEANSQKASLYDFSLSLPHSTICIDSLKASYQADRLEETLQYRGSTRGTQLTPSDLAFLSPTLKDFNQSVNADIDFQGTASSLMVPRFLLHANDGSINLLASGSVETADNHPSWKVRVENLDMKNSLLQQLDHALQESGGMISRAGSIHLIGHAQGNDRNISVESHVSTDIGRASVNASYNLKTTAFNGHLDTDQLHLGKLLDNPDLGAIVAEIEMNGNSQELKANGMIPHLEYKGYSYKNIAINTTHGRQEMSGFVKIADPNFNMTIDGTMRWRQLHSGKKQAAVNIAANISHLVPQALHLSDKWGNAQFSTMFEADFVASSLNDAEGTIDIDDFIMAMPDSTNTRYHMDNLHIRSGYDDDRHFLKIEGDMGEAVLNGEFDWNTLQHSVINYAQSILPTFPGLSKTTRHTANNFQANIMLKDANLFNHLFNIPITLDQPLTMDISMNDPERQLSIKGNVPAFTYDGNKYMQGKVDIYLKEEDANCNAQIIKVMDNGDHLDMQLFANAADSKLATSFLWDNNKADDDSLKSVRGILNAITEVYTNDYGNPEAHVRIQPSQVTLRGTPWRLEPCDILYTDKHLMVDRFLIANGNRHLIIDGIASAQPTDSLMIDMNEMEVAYILDLVNFHSVSFEGMATGKTYVSQAFNEPDIQADLFVSDFKFEGGNMGTLLAQAQWNNADKQVDIQAVCDAGAECQTYIDGYISPARNDIDLSIRARGTNIEFCNSFTNSFLNNVSGKATGDVQLAGALKRIYLTGQLVVDGQASVTALNTTYQMRGDTIDFVPDDILFKGCQINDRHGNTAVLTGGVHHESFKNITFDLDVKADNFLAYDFPQFNESIICGTVYATGRADLHGRSGEVVINCDVTPQPHSFFAYNAANPDAISQQDFITWGESTPHIAHVSSVNSQPVSTSDIHINFNINATPEGTLKVLMDQHTGDYITLNGQGQIKASFYNKGPFNMFGTYTVSRGTYGITIQNIIKKNFTFNDGGTIVFGGDPFNANLSLQALYTVNGVSLSDLNIGNSFANNTVRVNCLMNIQGTPGAPRVEFDLDMPTVNTEEKQMIRSVITSEQEMNQQVLYLLGIGRFYTQGANNANTQQYDQTSLAMQSFLSGTVSTQINEVLSQVIKSNDWNFGANISTGNEGWHNAEYEGTVSGRMLNNRLLINGQFGYRDNATQTTPSFIGDFDIRYLLNQSGNIALKVYNQTNDRYFTRSSLNTQGVGIIMKKDFNGLYDLFRTRKK